MQTQKDSENVYFIHLPPIHDSEKLSFLEWEISVINIEKSFCFRTSNFSVSVAAKNFPTAVIAVPHFLEEQGTTVFMPCGTILPYSKQLTWEQGYAAAILSDIYKKSIRQNVSQKECAFQITCFNWEKFLLALNSKGSSKNFNPWLFDMERMEELIMERNFDAANLSQSKSILISKEDILQKANQFLYSKNLDFETKAVSVTNRYFPLLENQNIPCFPQPICPPIITLECADQYYANIKAVTSKNFSLELVKCR